jgi:hypothetical protein
MWQRRPTGKLKRRWPKTLDHYTVDFPQKLQDLALDDMNEHQSMAGKAMETPENEVKLDHLVLKRLLDKHQRAGVIGD